MKSMLVCWGLKKEHIDTAARDIGLDPNRLTEKHYNDIVNNFIRKLDREKMRWKIIMEDAIESAVR